MGQSIRSESTPLDFFSEEIRSPLQSQNLNSQSATQVKSVRRKEAFLRNSSDTIPSSHASIFEAEYLSGSDDVALRVESWTLSNARRIQSNVEQDESRINPPFLSEIGITPILYGHGTQLTTIVEQKSLATMRSAQSNPSISMHKSRPPSSSALSQLSNFTTDAQTPSFLTTSNSFESSDMLKDSSERNHPRRKKSYSADDLATLKNRKSYHDACVMIESTMQSPLPIHEVYAEPKAPVLPPLERPGTPPGVPSWTQGQRRLLGQGPGVSEDRGQRRRSSFRNFLRSEFSLSRNSVPAPRGAVQPASFLRCSSSPDLEQRAPRFRPVRSGHGMGPLESHPFLRVTDTSRKEESAIGPAMPPFSSAYSTSMVTNASIVRNAERLRDEDAVQHSTVQLALSAAERVTSEPSTRDRCQVQTIRNCVHAKRKEVCSHLKRSMIAMKGSTGASVDRQWRGLFGRIHRTCSDPTQQQTIPSISVLPSTPTLDLQHEQVFQSPTVAPTIDGQDQERLMSSSMPAATPPDPESTCWRCWAKSVLKKIDLAWEAGARWSCWVCCGVQLDDDEYQEMDELLRPRRIVVDGVGVMVYA